MHGSGRASHSKRIRNVTAILVWIGFPFAYITGMVPDYKIHIIPALISSFFVLLLITLAVTAPPLTECEGAANTLQRQGLFRVLVCIACLWGIIVTGKICVLGVDMSDLSEFGPALAIPLICMFLAIVLYKK